MNSLPAIASGWYDSDSGYDPESFRPGNTYSNIPWNAASVRSSVSVKNIEGANNLLVDNTTCMESIIRHFIDVHGFTRLCFMTGPKER